MWGPLINRSFRGLISVIVNVTFTMPRVGKGTRFIMTRLNVYGKGLCSFLPGYVMTKILLLGGHNGLINSYLRILVGLKFTTYGEMGLIGLRGVGKDRDLYFKIGIKDGTTPFKMTLRVFDSGGSRKDTPITRVGITCSLSTYDSYSSLSDLTSSNETGVASVRQLYGIEPTMIGRSNFFVFDLRGTTVIILSSVVRVKGRVFIDRNRIGGTKIYGLGLKRSKIDLRGDLCVINGRGKDFSMRLNTYGYTITLRLTRIRSIEGNCVSRDKIVTTPFRYLTSYV